MTTSVSTCDTYTNALSGDAIWIELYPRLLCITRRFVYMYRIPCWYGQEEEIAGDVAQETARRLIERSQKVAQGEAAPIVNESISMSEVATENAYSEWLFLAIALEIANFPCKQRRAMLIDLANRMHFDEHPTPLQAAFLAAGIDLRDYQQSLSDNPEERARYAENNNFSATECFMNCPHCASVTTTEQPRKTTLGYRIFRYSVCKHLFSERTGTPFHFLEYPTDIVLRVVLWRLRYKLSLRDLAEMFLERGFVFSHQTVREWEVRFAPFRAEQLRVRRHGHAGTSCIVMKRTSKCMAHGVIFTEP